MNAQIIIPCQTDYLSYRGIDRLMATIDELNEDSEVQTKVLGVLATMYNSRSKDDKEILELLKSKYEVVGTSKRTVDAKRGMYDGKSVVDAKAKSDIVREYTKVAEKIISLE